LKKLVGEVAADGFAGVSVAFAPRLVGEPGHVLFKGLAPQTARRNSRTRLAASSSNQSSSVIGTMPSASAGKVL
jgi:hypothetical protein